MKIKHKVLYWFKSRKEIVPYLISLGVFLIFLLALFFGLGGFEVLK